MITTARQFHLFEKFLGSRMTGVQDNTNYRQLSPSWGADFRFASFELRHEKRILKAKTSLPNKTRLINNYISKITLIISALTVN
jgi:hypothetical protein